MAKSRKVSVPVHEQELWDEPEIAAVASASITTVRLWARKGLIRRVSPYVARRNLYRRDEVMGFLAGLESEPVVEG